MNSRDILKALIDQDYGGVQARFARAVDRKPSVINQWLSGHRKLDVKASRHLEEKLRLPVGYFQGATGQVVNIAEPLPAPYIHSNETTRRIITMLDATDEAGRGVALNAVTNALKEYAAGQVKLA
jgi:hypothetical protein